MEPKNVHYFKTREEWRKWLEKNHNKEKEVWLISYKKHTNKPNIPYDDAVEEAICFGWIDSVVKRIDDEKHMQKFTPRRNNSPWAESNIKRAEKMIRFGRMTKAGLEKYRPKTIIPQIIEMPKDLEKTLKTNKKAWINFQKFPTSHKKHFFWLIKSAKKMETRERRIKEIVKRATENRRLDSN